MKEIKIIITIGKDDDGEFTSFHCETNGAHVYDLMLAAYQLFGIIQKKDPDGTAFATMFNLANQNAKKNENEDNNSDSNESK